MKSDYFVEFLHHNVALKQQERFKFMIDKYKRNREDLINLKDHKAREIDSFINILEILNNDLKEFKQLIPKPSGSNVQEEEKTIKKEKKKNKKKKKTKPKAPKGSLEELKLGLKSIRDELDQM